MRHVLAATFVAVLGCGGQAVIDGESEGGGTPNECANKPCGTPCHISDPTAPTGLCTVDGQCAYDTSCPGPCDGKACGDVCEVCNGDECTDGVCGALGACAPELPNCQ